MLLKESTNKTSQMVGIAACRPGSMLLDVRNACADAQGEILHGDVGVGEVWLHSKSFSR